MVLDETYMNITHYKRQNSALLKTKGRIVYPKKLAQRFSETKIRYTPKTTTLQFLYDIKKAKYVHNRIAQFAKLLIVLHRKAIQGAIYDIAHKMEPSLLLMARA